MDFLAYFSKDLTNPAFNFCAFGRKTLFARNFWENFQRFSKENCLKRLILAYFSNKFNKPIIEFLLVWTKNAICRKLLRKLSKILKKFLRKFLKWIILAYFAKHLTNPELIFGASGRKTQFIGNFEKIFEIKKTLKKIDKNALFKHVFQNI